MAYPQNKHGTGRWIPDLPKYDLQQLHDLMESAWASVDYAWASGNDDAALISSGQIQFIYKLMDRKTKAGETVVCEIEDCGTCKHGELRKMGVLE
jgi:hypothetical protein